MTTIDIKALRKQCERGGTIEIHSHTLTALLDDTSPPAPGDRCDRCHHGRGKR